MPHIKKFNEDSLNAMVTGIAFREYPDLVRFRKRVDDCLQGQKTIKSKMEYLPPNMWQRDHPDEYHAYLERALFYSLTAYAMRIYEGLTLSGYPEIALPADGRMDFMREYATVHRRSLHALQSSLNREQFSHGLRCMLAEPTGDDERPFVIQEFGANSFIRSHFTQIGGESRADLVLVNESGYAYDVVSKTDRLEPKFLVLGLDAAGEYYQAEITPDKWAAFDVRNPGPVAVRPSYRGRRLDFIPFTWCGASSLSGTACDIPPLLDMADCEIKLFGLDAQYSQHLYAVSQETVFFRKTRKGFRLDEIRYGNGAHNALPDEVEPMVLSANGRGLDQERAYMDDILHQIELRRMSIMSSKSHQSGTAVGIVQNAQTAPLRTIVATSGAAITEQLRMIAGWMGYGDGEVAGIHYNPSNDFANTDSNMSEFVALCQAVADGSVPMLEEDLYTLARENAYVNSLRSWDEFKRRWRLERLARSEAELAVPVSAYSSFSRLKKEEASSSGDSE